MIRQCALIFDAPDGGVPEHVLRVAVGLRERGWHPWVVGPEVASIHDALRQADIPVVGLPFRPGYRHAVSEVRILRNMIALMRRHRFDLVSTHSPKAGALGRLAAIALGIPVVCTAHGFAFDPRHRRWPARAFSLAIERRIATRTDAIICVSEDMRRLALARRLVSPASLHVIHNGAPRCDPTLALDPELESFSHGGPLAGCMCVLSPHKGVAVFLEAAREVLRNLPGARFAVIGDGVSRKALERHSHVLGLDGQLRFFHYQHPSARQLRSLDVFVLPSLYDAFPVGPLEAMACGVPQVATDVGGTSEAVSDGVTGLLCPPNDSSALADRISRLLSDPSLRTRMGHASRERHRELFTLDRMLDETADVFDRVIARRSEVSDL